MKTLFLLGLSLLAVARAEVQTPVALSVSASRICALGFPDPKEPFLSQILCWLPNGKSETLYEGRKATEFVVGERLGMIQLDYGCAVVDKRLKCWGVQGPKIQELFRDFENVTHAKNGFADFCASDAVLGLRCWGGDFPVSRIEELMPRLPGVKALAIGMHMACALDGANQLHCWGGLQEKFRKSLVKNEDLAVSIAAEKSLLLPPKASSRISSLTVGFGHACFNDSGRVRCWGESPQGETDTKGIQTSSSALVDAGFQKTCIASAEKVLCIGRDGGDVAGRGSRVGFPVQLVSSKVPYSRMETTCVMGDHALACVGNQTITEPHPLFAFSLHNLEIGLRRLTHYLNQRRASVFERSAAFVERYPIEATPARDSVALRLFVANALEVFLANMDPPNVKNQILPQYRSVLAYLNQSQERPITRLIELPVSHGTLLACTRLLLDTLDTSKDFVGIKYQEVLGDVFANLGMLYTKGDLKPSDFGLVVALLEELNPGVDDIVTAVRMTPHGILIRTLESYLSAAVKDGEKK